MHGKSSGEDRGKAHGWRFNLPYSTQWKLPLKDPWKLGHMILPNSRFKSASTASKPFLYPPEVAYSRLIASEELPMMSISGTLGTSLIEAISVQPLVPL
jgi:hypothetical protein